MVARKTFEGAVGREPTERDIAAISAAYPRRLLDTRGRAVGRKGWILLAISVVVVLAALAVHGWRRRAEAALEIATVDAPSFGDVLRRRNASEASQL